MTYALYYIGTGDLVKRIGSMRLAGLAGSASCVLVLTHFSVVGKMAVLSQLRVPVYTWSALMAVLSTALPIYWLSLGIQRSVAGASLAPALIGVFVGQSVRARVRADTFRLFFFIGLLMLGAHLAWRFGG